MNPVRLLRARTRKTALGTAVALLALTLAGAWLLRPMSIVHGTFMLYYKHPAVVTIPLLVLPVMFALAVGVHAMRGGLQPTRTVVRNDGSGRRAERVTVSKAGRLLAPATVAAGGMVLTFFVVLGFTHALTMSALAHHTDYGTIDAGQLTGGEVRVKPREVAEQQIQGSLNSSTEKPTNLHVVKVDGRLTWTAVRDPDGTIRSLTKRSQGVMSSDGETTGPGVTVHGKGYDAPLRYGPGMHVRDNLKWRIYKTVCFACDVAEMTAVPTADGPVIIAPYLRYRGGLFARRPVLGGVVIAHADGRLEDLTVKQAQAHPLVAASGRLFPEKLARAQADAYVYRHGIYNKLVTRTDGYQVADTGGNAQPYLQDFKQLGTQWTTTLKPRGNKTQTTGMVMLTDTVTGKVRVWRADQQQSLIGPGKALEIVRGERLGVTFSDNGGNGNFRAVEPRQVFPGGKLQFLVSVIPNRANRVTLSVVVDAASQRVVKVFPSSDAGDQALIAYLQTGANPADYDFSGSADGGGPLNAVGGGSADPAAPSEPALPVVPSTVPAGKDAVSTLQRLLAQNAADQKATRGRMDDLRAQAADLRRLLNAARNGK